MLLRHIRSAIPSRDYCGPRRCRQATTAAGAASTGTFCGQAMTKGDIYTGAGNGMDGYSGDGGPATKARLYYPSGVALDAAGNLLIADSQNNRIREVAG